MAKSYLSRADVKTDVIRFACEACNHPMKALKAEIGQGDCCPKCDAPFVIPEVSDRSDEDKAVDMGISVPQVGGMKTRVTQKTADSMASTFLGGILVAVGVIVCAMFSLRSSSKS